MVTYPNDWRTYPFKKFFRLIPNNTLSRDKLSSSGTIGNIHYGDVLIKYGDTISDQDDIPRVREDIDFVANNLLQKNDVIIADTAEDETVGKVTQVGDVSIPLVGGLHTVVCRPNIETADGYLGCYMNSRYYHDQLLPYITGIKVSSVSKKSLNETEITIPDDIQEQKAIVSIFNDMDRHISNITELIEKKHGIRDGVLEDLMSGRMRLDGFCDPWIETTLKEFTDINPKTDVPESFMYVDLESVKGIQLLYSRRECAFSAPSRAKRRANKGDVFFQTVRPYQKNNFYFNLGGDYVFSTGYAQLRTWNNPKFLFLLIREDSFVQKVLDECTGTSYPAINPNRLAEISIVVPANVKEQEAIAEIVQSMDKEIEALEIERDKMIQIREGAMDDLLTGRVRLKV